MQQYDDVAQRYHRLIEPKYAPIAAAALGRLPTLTGRVVLEVGAGSGLLTALIAARGGYRSFTATDISPGMLGIARERVSGTADFVVADLLKLPTPDASLDLVVSSLTPLQDTVEGFREARRVLKPGGRLVIALWGDDYAELRLLSEVRARLGLDPYPSGRRAGALARAREAGFSIVSADDLQFPVQHDSAEAYFAYRLAFGRPPFIAPERVGEFHTVLRQTIERWAQPDGTIALDWSITILTVAV